MNEHTLIIRSEDRGNESKSRYDAQFHLNDVDLHSVNYCALKDVCLPNTIYNITAANNTLSYELTGTPTSVVLTPGYYTVTTFITAMNALLATTIVITDNSATHLFAWTSPANSQILASSTMASIVGITADTAVATSYSSDSIYNFIPTKMIHVLSTTLAEYNNVSASNKLKYPILGSFALDVGNSYIKFHEQNRDTMDSSAHKGSLNMSSIDIQLVDDNFNVIDLNGSDWYASFIVRRR